MGKNFYFDKHARAQWAQVKAQNHNYQTANFEQTIANLNHQIANLNNVVADLNAENQRLNAQLQNLPKNDQIISFLPIYDQLTNLLTNPNFHFDENTTTGLRMLTKQFAKILASAGVQKISIKTGDAFDYHYMEALDTIHANTLPNDTVYKVLRPAYSYQNKIVQHALVTVNIR